MLAPPVRLHQDAVDLLEVDVAHAVAHGLEHGGDAEVAPASRVGRDLLKQALAEDGVRLMAFRKGSASELASALGSTLGTDADGGASERWFSETEHRCHGVVELKGQPWAVALMEEGKRVDKGRTFTPAKELSASGELVVPFGDQVHTFDDGDGRDSITRFRGGGRGSALVL